MTIIYLFDPETGEYVGTKEARLDPFGKELLPDHNHKSRTTIAPPEVEDGYARVFDRDAQAWKQVEDHRKDTVYDIKGGREKKIKALGPLPRNVTTKVKPSDWHKFDDRTGDWAEDTTAKTAEMIRQAAQQRVASAAPGKVSADDIAIALGWRSS